jgi:hypothetical protein
MSINVAINYMWAFHGLRKIDTNGLTVSEYNSLSYLRDIINQVFAYFITFIFAYYNCSDAMNRVTSLHYRFQGSCVILKSVPLEALNSHK